MRIFIIGQCTLHWGRMEYGNIGNYYIIKPMFEQLRRVYPDAEFVTTMQLSEEFCHRFEVDVVPMEYYYDFNRADNVEMAKAEYEAVLGNKHIESDYLKEVKKADLVIDFSGDIWGDNADFLGEGRFLTGIYKDLSAQHLKPTIMLAGSPGPFKDNDNMELIKSVYAGFDFVINREKISSRLLKEQGFELNHTKDFPCPSWLFEPCNIEIVKKYINNPKFYDGKKLRVGMILCGWNFQKPPFDLWPREEHEYDNFIAVINYLVRQFNAEIFLLSHSNGFPIPPEKFELQHGRDFKIVNQLYSIIDENVKANVTLLDGVYPAEVTKGIISQLDILISGRMHGAVAGLASCVPTMIIDYGHEPKAHKLKGYAEIAGIEEYIADPNNMDDLLFRSKRCVENRKVIRDTLTKNMREIKKEAADQFDFIAKSLDI